MLAYRWCILFKSTGRLLNIMNVGSDYSLPFLSPLNDDFVFS